MPPPRVSGSVRMGLVTGLIRAAWAALLVAMAASILSDGNRGSLSPGVSGRGWRSG